MKKILCLIFALITMILNGCGKTETPDAGKVTTTTTSTTAIATTTTTGDAETTYITVTGEDGAAVTDADGAAITSAIAIDPTTTATDAATTAADTTTTTTTTTVTPVVATTQAPVAQPTTTSTTAAPTTTTTAPVDDGNPWTWPCDWQGMEADCKAYVESQGWTWDANLNVDRGSWDGKRHTVWNELWENYNVLEDSIKQDISFYAGQGDTYFKCVFIPDENNDGHYHIYIVHGSGPVVPDWATPEQAEEWANAVVHEDFADLAKKAVN